MRIIKFVPITTPPLPVGEPPGIFRNTLRIRDLVQNINFQEALVRFGFTLVIPMLVLVVDKHLLSLRLRSLLIFLSPRWPGFVS